MTASEAVALDVRTVVMLGGNYRSLITRAKVATGLNWSSAHLCLRPADARDAAMTGPELTVGTIFKVAQNPTAFVALKISCDNTAKEEETGQPAEEGEGPLMIVKICVEAVDLLEAQRQHEEEVQRREFWRLSLAHLREAKEE